MIQPNHCPSFYLAPLGALPGRYFSTVASAQSTPETLERVIR